MRILIAGALAWNPERIRSLHACGHKLWGLWSRTMAWEQGPYPALEGCVTPVALEDASRTIREQDIDCVYSLFQVYNRALWAPAAPGVEHGVWTILRTLLEERARGAFDAPIVRHWGFDVLNLDPAVARAMDGHLFCNPHKAAYWSEPVADGGCGLDLVGEGRALGFLDSDRPLAELMGNDFSEPLSEADGEIHTVCVGRPFGIDYLAAARHGIHVHLYGNGADELHRAVARDLSPARARRNAVLLRRHLHVHEPLQPVGWGWKATRATKERWVAEFSRYDAAWSYIGTPFPWPAREDRGAMPNRLGTYLAAGLPVICDRRPGFHRYEEPRRLGVELELIGGDYAGLRGRLEKERRTRARREIARARRHEYSFEATIVPLIGALERACAGYLGRSHRERVRFAPGGEALVHLDIATDARSVARGLLGGLRPGTPGAAQARRVVARHWRERRRIPAPLAARRLRRRLRSRERR
jgi:hypothetical protein